MIDKVYQLKANGCYSVFSNNGTIYSKTVWTSKEAAENNIPKFKELVTEKNSLTSLVDDDSLRIIVIELNVVDDVIKWITT